MQPDTGNTMFQLAVQFVNQTGRTLFLTGKAGTGKTTFLKYIRENTFKKMAVVAPTGVAAINAGGVTMHSFFQLPFGPYVPVRQTGWNTGEPGYSDPDSLFRNIRFNTNKRELLKELELLVIDEVSMVRADTLDAVDTILRHFREQPQLPFGGVQVIYIGDLFQLPPVVPREEWELLRQHYKSQFFFDAKVIHESPPIYLELTKIYRQNEEAFINILNNIRNNRPTAADMEKLHDYYDPDFVPPGGSNYITLTSHNASADNINQMQVNNLPGKLHAFEATVTGDFSEKAYPAEKTLQLKEGAQVMLIKNDKGESRRYYNGKIGVIRKLTTEKITISFAEEPDELELEKETWRNIRYNFNKEKDKIEEEELGTFSQYPIRLAWAITIHKSQGLTFEKAVIDAGSSFAAGQVYVALSRLTSIDGLVLRSRITAGSIQTDQRVIGFTESRMAEDVMSEQLKQEQLHFIATSLIRTFDWSTLTEQLQEHVGEIAHRQMPDKIKALEAGKTWLASITEQRQTAAKFSRQLEQLLQAASAGGYDQLHQRIEAATDYFIRSLQEDLIQPLEDHTKALKSNQKARKYKQSLKALEAVAHRKKIQLEEARKMVAGLLKGEDTTHLLTTLQEDRKKIEADVEKTGSGLADNSSGSTGKPRKGDTNRLTLQLYREGVTITEIARQRGLAVTTIESHLSSFILTGEIAIEEIVPENKIASIVSAIEIIGGPALGPIKQKLGDDYSFGEIRAVMNHIRRNSAGQEQGQDDLP